MNERDAKHKLGPVSTIAVSRVAPLFGGGPYFFRPLVFFVVFLFFAGAVSALAQESEANADPARTPWRITADQVRYDPETARYFAAGDVLILKDNVRLSADKVRFDHKTMEAVAQGRVMLVSGKDVLTGERMEIDLNRETGTVYDGTVFIDENHFYIRGDRLEKTGKDTYKAERASLTTCDGDSPAWKITARDVEVTIDGYGSARHAALFAKKAPVFYSPYLFFPVKTKRQTGLLPPRFGYSDRKGVEYAQPFFWAVDDSSDATFFEHFMSRRGHRFGGEFRYKSSSLSKGAVMAEMLNDREIDDGQGNSSDQWGYSGDRYTRPNGDRYWFRAKHDQELPGGFSAKLDLDIASDQDYLNEIAGSYMGFDDTDSYFLEAFGRDLDEYDDPVRVNSLNVSKYWNRYSLNMDARWYDNVIARRHFDEDTTLHKLPSFNFNGLRQPVFGSMLYFDLESEYVYFFREDSFTGHRMDLHPRVYLPLRFRNFVSFEPSAGIRETIWHIDNREDLGDGIDRSNHRELPDLRLDLTSEIARSFNVDLETADRIKHTMRPRVVYEYIPATSQEDLPEFDEIDRINKQSVVTYSITNTFSRRYSLAGPKKKDGPKNDSKARPGAFYGYRPFGRLKIEQSYDFNETEDDRPFSPVFAELDLILGRRFALGADVQWSTYDDRFVSQNVAVRASDDRGDRLFLEHRYARDLRESLYGDAVLKLHERISVFAEYERNMKDGETLLYGAGLLFMSNCWSLDLGYSKEKGDKKYAMMINLYGLGGIGKQYAGREIRNPFEFE